MSVANLTSHHTLPPFSDQVKTAPIVSISLAKLEAGDVTETDAWWDASKQLGFFYLSLEGSELGVSLVTEAEKLNVLQKHFFALPNEEKERFRGDLKTHSIFTYRYNDIEEKDGNGVAKRNQSYNVSCVTTRSRPLMSSPRRYEKTTSSGSDSNDPFIR